MKCPKCKHGRMVQFRSEQVGNAVVRGRRCDLCKHTLRYIEKILSPMKTRQQHK